MLQGRGVAIICKCKHNNTYSIFACIIDKILLSLTFNWLINKIYRWTIITSNGYDCTISIYIYILQTLLFLSIFITE